MLHIDGVAHQYEGPGGTVPALSRLSFTVRDGEFVSIVGPSGCGKSTLLRIIAGLLHPSEGSVTLNGKLIDSPQREIGLVFQQPTLMPWRTVLDNVALPLELEGVSQEIRVQAAQEVITRVGLAGFEQHFPAQLSGGMAQRVGIGRALIYDPDVLLLDEPFGALDALTREQMALELMTLWTAERKTAIMVTHSISEAVFLSERVLVMSKRPGAILADIPITLPRPRNLDMLYAPDFGSISQQIHRALE